MEDNRFYIYAHFKLDTNELFYIGKGTNNRISVSFGKNSYWKNIVKKHGYYYKKIEDNLNELDALNGEIFYIKHFKMIGYKLCNLTDGGDGMIGMTINLETRKKMSLAKLGKIGNRKGSKVSEITKNKLSILNTGSNSPSFGKKRSKETCDKIRESKKNKKEVLQYSKEMILINEYVSISEAARNINTFNSNIVKCLKGKINSCKGFIWKYKI